MGKRYFTQFPSGLKVASTSILILVGLTLCHLIVLLYGYKPFINKDNRSQVLQPATMYIGKDNGCNNIKTTYKMHKLLNDDGPNLSPKQRAQLVQNRCRTFLKENNMQLNLNANCKFDNEAFMISRRYDLSICYHCKVASTNTKRVLYGLDHNFSLTDNINNIPVPVVGRYTRTCKVNFHRLHSKKRKVHFMLVREPLERLLSAYLDKRAFGKYYKDPTFSFERFLKRITELRSKSLDRHIYPFFERCRPCEIQFDYIGIQNLFVDDMKILLQEIKASDKVAIPERTKTGYNISLTRQKLLKHYFENVPNKLIHDLWAKYYKDYYMFGFPYPSHLMN